MQAFSATSLQEKGLKVVKTADKIVMTKGESHAAGVELTQHSDFVEIVSVVTNKDFRGQGLAEIIVKWTFQWALD